MGVTVWEEEMRTKTKGEKKMVITVLEEKINQRSSLGIDGKGIIFVKLEIIHSPRKILGQIEKTQ